MTMSKQYPFLDLAEVNAPYMEQMKEAASRVISSGRYIGGEEVGVFEKELVSYIGVPHAVGVSNGLDALRLILRAWIVLGKLQQGDKIIVPANTYIASVLAISDAGLTPVLVDPDPITLNISADAVDKILTPDVKGIMPVHLYGRVAWDDDLRDIIHKHDLLSIEDCAQAIGARALTSGLYGGNMAGALCDAAAISFYPTKNTGALGDAGAVLTHSGELADTVRALANYGSDRRYHNKYRGFNCRLDPIQAAMLRVKLPHNDEENMARIDKAALYGSLINRKEIITPPIAGDSADCVWHQYVIQVTDGKRDLMQRLLSEHGVTTDIHYAIPPHLQPCYETLSHGPLPVTELTTSRILSLPIARGTTRQDVMDIADIINNLNLD